MINFTILRDRAEMLQKCRAFFQKRGLLEVDTPSLSPFGAVDLNIDLIPAQVSISQPGYLHTSPEYAMKQLLSAHHCDLYYLGHVFRQGEIGPRHNPEFTMAEWYRLYFTFEQMIEETCAFLSLFLGPLPIRTLTYREAFETHLDLNYTEAPLSLLLAKAAPYNPSPDSANWPRDTLIQFLLSHAIEPHLGQNELTALIYYPPQEAALARTLLSNNELVAERFEIYHRGIELANGYHELPDSAELRRRFEQANLERLSLSKPAYPLDEPFLASLGSSFPDCCGVSVGFDRALMLRHRAKALSEVVPFAWA